MNRDRRTQWILLLFASLAAAQDRTGGVSGVVIDAVTHQPVRKATVSLSPHGVLGARPQNAGPKSATTDATGSFSITDVDPGTYQLMIQHQNYPQPRNGAVRKSVEIKAGEKAGPVNMELIPGASVSGHVVDEDGDPLAGCTVQARSAPGIQGFSGQSAQTSPEDGTYRLFGLAPGKYFLSAICRQPAFQPRPFSTGPELPPSAAYPTQYYPATGDPKSAEAVELFPGSEKAGIEFQMRPSAVTQVDGTFSGGVDRESNTNLIVQMIPVAEKMPRFLTNARVDRAKGTFDFPQVFPGSYMLIAFTNGNPSGRMGAMQRIDVQDKPVETSVALRAAMTIEGTIQIEGNNAAGTNPLTPSQCNLGLMPEYQVGMPPGNSQVKDDGSFTIQAVFPGFWRLRVNALNGFLKSAWLGTTEVTNSAMDLTSGAPGALKLVISTNTGTLHGTGPPGQTIFAQEIDPALPFPNFRGTNVDQSGQFKLEGLGPGKYRIVASEPGGPPAEDGGQEVTVHEGETLTIEIKAPSN